MTHVRIHTLKPARQLTERDMGKTVTIGAVTGVLDALLPVAGHIEIGLKVGNALAWFTLTADADVDVWGRPRKAAS